MQAKVLAFYIRLSVEDGDLRTSEKTESNSVSNQRKILLDYYKKNEDLREYKIVEFCDDGYSGTNFNRPQFQQMMEMIRQGAIHGVIVKDLSRFGREYLEVSGYLELILPLFRVRFISVTDSFDSNDYIGTTGGMELALHNLINSMYSRDLSAKVRSAIRTRNKRGNYWGGQAFYGYLIDPKNKYRLIVDEKARSNVELIFSLCIKGFSTAQIAQELNARNILSPAEYKKQNGMFYNGRTLEKGSLWLGSTIRKILNDERYTGKMISGTRTCVGIRTNKTRVVPKEDWLVVENTHEAIISKETFLKASEALKSRIRTVNKNTAGNRKDNLFVCGYCGRKLQKSQAVQTHLFCIKAQNAPESACSSLHENMAQLQITALKVIKAFIAILLDKAVLEKRKIFSKQTKLEKQIRAAETNLYQIQNGKGELYEEYRSGRMTKEKFMQIQMQRSIESENLQQRVLELKEKLQQWKKQQAALQSVTPDAERIQMLNDYQPQIISKLVDCIRVFAGGKIEIVFKNQDVFQPASPRIYTTRHNELRAGQQKQVMTQ